jgi:hypothetical protein
MNVFHDRRPDTYRYLADEDIYNAHGTENESRSLKTAPERKRPRRRGAGR